MDLVSEYYQRTGVQTPLIRYVPNGNLILRKKDGCHLEGKYEIVTISFTNKDGIAGSFQFMTSAPAHNSYKANRQALVCMKDKRIVWDEYEDYVHEFVENYSYSGKVVPIVGKDELTLACWEMLLVSYDSVFAELPTHYLDLLYLTMDYSLTAAGRLEYVNSLVACMKNCQEANLAAHVKLLSQGWVNCNNYMDPYAYWLAKLFK